jgi:hypothetical protein
MVSKYGEVKKKRKIQTHFILHKYLESRYVDIFITVVSIQTLAS